jgi:hypothetical protein
MVQDQRSGGQSKDQCNDLHHVTQTWIYRATEDQERGNCFH